MIALIQRVTEASVAVSGSQIANIGIGMLALIGVEKSDTTGAADKLASRLLSYRIFPDEAGRMNLDLVSAGGELLLVPQFTLVADTRKGRRPGFSQAALPDQASQMFDYLAQKVRLRVERLEVGQFGADMQVSLINDGPVTFWLQEHAEHERSNVV